MMPSVPTLAKLTTKMMVPCLPHIFLANVTPAMYDKTLLDEEIPVVPEPQLQLGYALWEALWPDISQDHEAITAVQEAARRPESPLWQSALEQGLISIFSKNKPLAAAIAEQLRAM